MSGLLLLALLSTGAILVAFASWSGLWTLGIIANPFVALLLRHTILLNHDCPRNCLLLGLGVVAIAMSRVGYVLTFGV